MTDPTLNDPVQALDALLDREREALIRGALDQLPELMAEKVKLADQLNQSENPDPPGLEQIRGKAARNRELLTSALEGIRAVADRIAELRRIRQGLETYDRAGRKTRHPGARPANLEKRA